MLMHSHFRMFVFTVVCALTGSIVFFYASPVSAIEECTQTPDCDTNQICENSSCRDIPIGSDCEQDDDCGLGQQCTGGECIEDDLDARAATTTVGTGARPPAPIIPQLNVPIPGLQLGTGSGAGNPLLAQYISGIYRYGLSIVTVVATIMFIYGAFLYLLGSAITSIQSGKQIMKDAIMGMILLVSAYTILRVVNPNLVSLDNLGLTTIQTVPYEPVGPEAMARTAAASESYAAPSSGGATASDGGSKGCGEDNGHLLIDFNWKPASGTTKQYPPGYSKILVSGAIRNCPGTYPVIFHFNGNDGGRGLLAQNGAVTALKNIIDGRWWAGGKPAKFKPVIIVFLASQGKEGDLYPGLDFQELKQAALETLKKNPETKNVDFSSISVAGHSGIGCNQRVWGDQITQEPIYAMIYADTCFGMYDLDHRPEKLIGALSLVMRNTYYDKFNEAHEMTFKGKCRRRYRGPWKGCYESETKDYYFFFHNEANHGWPISLTYQFALEYFFPAEE